MTHRVLVGILLLTNAFLDTRATAQCLNWDTSFASVPFNGEVHALRSFDDGSGPALYVAGYFLGHVQRWNGSTWASVGWVDENAFALDVYDDGTGASLYIGGGFTQTNLSASTPGIARWNGVGWTSVGGGVVGADPLVWAFTVYDAGSGPWLYVGGHFQGAQGVNSSGILRWNGTNWLGVGGGVDWSGPGDAYVRCMAVYDDGTGAALYVGGDFTHTGGGLPVNNVAKWDGVSWSSLGTGLSDGAFAMASYDDGSGSKLHVGGQFSAAGGVTASNLARWNGTSWSAPSGVSGIVFSLKVFDDGNGPALFVAGLFPSAGGLNTKQIARWNGTSWSSLGSGMDGSPVYALALHDDGLGGGTDLYVGGSFGQAGSIPSDGVARWHGCAGPLDAICFGDGTVTNCPCGNQGLAGRGCRNSLSANGARLVAGGSISPDTINLTSSGELANSLTIFLQGSGLTQSPQAFGDGILCMGGILKRLYVKVASGGTAQAPQAGDPSITQQSANLGDPISPGMIRYYQAYYRDPSTSFCAAPTGSTFNSSNGLRIVW